MQKPNIVKRIECGKKNQILRILKGWQLAFNHAQIYKIRYRGGINEFHHIAKPAN